MEMGNNWKNDLVDYLYGDCSESKRKRIASELAKNPEMAAEYNKLKEASGLIGSLEDEEVLIPELEVADKEERKVLRLSLFSKSVLSLAAAISLMLIAGYLLHFQVNIQKEGLILSFGVPKKEQDNRDYISRQEVSDLLDSINSFNKAKLDHQIEN